MCEKVSDIHQKHGVLWNHKQNQLPWVVLWLFNKSQPYSHTRCLEHVINLATVAVMSSITKIAAIESAQAIWEFDPTLDGNRLLGGSLDVIAAIRTIAIKVSDIRSESSVIILHQYPRFVHPDNVSNTSSNSRQAARSQLHSRSWKFITICDGEQPTAWLSVH